MRRAVPTAADLRAGIARHGLKHYVVAAHAEMDPTILRAYLNERRELTKEAAQRISCAISVTRIFASVKRLKPWLW